MKSIISVIKYKVSVLSRRAVLAYFAAALLLSGCNKFVEVEDPPHQLTGDKVFTSDNSATSAMLSIYIDMMNDQFGNNGSFACFSMSSLAGMSANEMTWTQNNTTAPIFQEFADHNLTPENSYVQPFWRDGYKYIFRTNEILNGLTNATGMTDAVKMQLQGEAKFMRAFCYFYLVNLFGDVPLIMHTDYKENMLLPRTAATKVWEQIITDLKEAKSLLKETYPTAERLRPNSFTAGALLARAYLYTGKWEDAEREADAIIASGKYGTGLPALNQVFKMNSPEAIWQLQPVRANSNTTEGAQFMVVGTTRPNYELTQQMLQAFELNDQRRQEWIGFSDPVNNPTWAFPAKYKAGTGSVTEYYVVFRLTEQYLIRSEARAQQGAAKLLPAKNDLDIVRLRAGLLPSAAADQTSLLQAIAQERRVEFFAEWGHRWLDLKRTNMAETALKPLSPAGTWKKGDDLYPIPGLEIRANPKLEQNEAYR